MSNADFRKLLCTATGRMQHPLLVSRSGSVQLDLFSPQIPFYSYFTFFLVISPFSLHSLFSSLTSPFFFSCLYPFSIFVFSFRFPSRYLPRRHPSIFLNFTTIFLLLTSYIFFLLHRSLSHFSLPLSSLFPTLSSLFPTLSSFSSILSPFPSPLSASPASIFLLLSLFISSCHHSSLSSYLLSPYISPRYSW